MDEQPKKKKPKKRRRPKAQRESAAFKQVDSYADWCKQNRQTIRRLTVALTERYTRTILGLRAKDPLYWKGLELVCIGSPAVRERTLRRAKAVAQVDRVY